MDKTIKKILALSQDIRYVALYRNGKLTFGQAPQHPTIASHESDKYEEILVNPTLLLLTKQRGDIDCGGRDWILIRYGEFFQFVQPVKGGHISICIAPRADPLKVIHKINYLLKKTHQL